MHRRTITLDDTQYRRTALAAAVEGVSRQRFISEALDDALARAANRNELTRLAFKYTENPERAVDRAGY